LIKADKEKKNLTEQAKIPLTKLAVKISFFPSKQFVLAWYIWFCKLNQICLSSVILRKKEKLLSLYLLREQNIRFHYCKEVCLGLWMQANLCSKSTSCLTHLYIVGVY